MRRFDETRTLARARDARRRPLSGARRRRPAARGVPRRRRRARRRLRDDRAQARAGRERRDAARARARPRVRSPGRRAGPLHGCVLRRAPGRARARAPPPGCVRDGHGDLRAEHVLLEHGVEIVDCLEFDPALRITDVGCDLAFLTHGPRGARLTVRRRHGARELPGGGRRSRRRRARARSSASTARSCARRWRWCGPGRRTIATAASRMRAPRLALAERLAWRARRPGLVIVAGLSATGKTTLADAARHALGPPAPQLRRGAQAAARHRPRRARRRGGLRHELQPPHVRGARPPRARGARARRDGVIVDATFRNARRSRGVPRRARRAAGRRHRRRVPGARCPCGCERARRAAASQAPSRTPTPRVVRRQAEDGGLVEDVPAGRHVVLRTDRPAADALDDLAALLDARLGRRGP